MKFEKEIKSGRKQFFFSEKDDFVLYRKDMFNFAINIINEIKESDKVLEVGPSQNLYKENIKQYDTAIINDYCLKKDIYYKTLDIDSSSKSDYIMSLENLSFINEKFDKIILLSVLEHVRKPWLVSKELSNILNKNGKLYINTPFLFKKHGPDPDCWRFTRDGLVSLFENHFILDKIITYPENEVEKNSIALSINTIWSKL